MKKGNELFARGIANGIEKFPLGKETPDRHSDMDRNGDATIIDCAKPWERRDDKPNGSEKLGDHAHAVDLGREERVQREHERLGAREQVQLLQGKSTE